MIESVRVSDDFIIQEFVPPNVYESFGNKSIWFIDIRVVHICQFLRDYFDKELTINDWNWGGSYINSGFRLENTTIGVSMSQHKYGRAADIKIQGISIPEIKSVIESNYIELRRLGLTTLEKIERTPTWLHFDVRYTGISSIFYV